MQAKFTVRVDRGRYVVFGDIPNKSGMHIVEKGSTKNPPQWLQLVLDVAALGDYREPVWATLDENYCLLSFV